MRTNGPRVLLFLGGLAGLGLYLAARAGARPLAPTRASLDETLDRLSRVGKLEVGAWKWKLGDDPRGADPSLDDSSWAPAAVGHSWNGEKTAGWYRASVEIPARVAGWGIAGSVVRLEVGIDDFGEIWVNGEKRQDFEWDKGAVELSPSARPGERLLVALRAKNRWGPGRLLHARLSFSSLADVEAAVGVLAESLKVGRKIVDVLGKKESRWNAVLDGAANGVDLAAADRGDRPGFLGSVEKARASLSALRPLTEGYRLRCAGYAHIDLAWLWRWIETVQVCKETFQSALDFMGEFPDFRFSMSQSHSYRWMEERHPDLFAAIQAAVAAGKWEIVGGTAVELDCNLPDAESHIRQILHGQRYFEKKFGRRARIGWCPDSFGYNWNLPQILKKAGLDYFLTAKISWNDTNKFPHNLFWWEAPDGSRVLSFLPLGGYGNDLEAEPMIDFLKEVEGQTGYREILMVYGVGNHGGGPTREMIERQERLAKIDFYPKIEKSTAIDYFEGIAPEARAKLPVWKDELYLEYHRGTYTTQAANKRANRKGEVGLVTAEKAAAIAQLFGNPYPSQTLERAWDFLLFNQMHDILPGSSITPVYRDSAEDYARMFAGIDRVIRNSLADLARRIDWTGVASLAARSTPSPRSERPIPLVVFNPLSFERDDVAVYDLTPRDPIAPHYVARDAEGTVIPSQVVTDDLGRRSVLFRTRIPSVGYRVYTLHPSDRPTSVESTVFVAEAGGGDFIHLGNEALGVDIERKTGNLARVLHKPTERNALEDGKRGNRIQLLEDKPKMYDAWELGFTGKEWALDTARSVEILETGPVRVTVRVKKDFLGDSKEKRAPTEDFPSSFFTQDISLYAGIPWLETRFAADWWESHVCAKVAFPLSVHAENATYEIPYAHLERSTKRETPWEKARYEVSAQKWADLSSGNFGVSLLNEAKYGYDTLDNVMRLTLFRAPTSPDPGADRGRHAFAYALYPHEGGWREGGTVPAAYRFNHSLVVLRMPTEADASQIPTLSTSFAASWGGTSFAPFDTMGVSDELRANVGGSIAPPGRLFDPNVPAVGRPGPSAFAPTPLPASMSFVQVDAPNVIAPVIKKHDASDAWIVRLYEWAGKPSTEVTLSFSFEVASASIVDLMEENPTPATVAGKTVSFTSGPHAITTILVTPGRR